MAEKQNEQQELNNEGVELLAIARQIEVDDKPRVTVDWQRNAAADESVKDMNMKDVHVSSRPVRKDGKIIGNSHSMFVAGKDEDHVEAFKELKKTAGSTRVRNMVDEKGNLFSVIAVKGDIAPVERDGKTYNEVRNVERTSAQIGPVLDAGFKLHGLNVEQGPVLEAMEARKAEREASRSVEAPEASKGKGERKYTPEQLRIIRAKAAQKAAAGKPVSEQVAEVATEPAVAEQSAEMGA